MRKIILILAALTVAVGASAQTTFGPQYEEAIQTNGKAERKVTPDEIYVAITIKDGDTKGQSVNQLESRFKSELTAAGIDVAKNLKVTGQNLAPRRKNTPDTARSYELKVGDTWTLGSVFEILGEMGVSDARVVRVAHSQIESFRDEVRTAAVKDAQRVARVLAGAVGQSIGVAVSIYDSGSYESSPVPMVKTRGMAYASTADNVYANGTAEQAIDMQDITLSYNVSAKFILNRK